MLTFAKLILSALIFVLFFTNSVKSQTIVEWYTSMGNFKGEMREDIVPNTANNFITLANQNFFDNIIFHRVIADFMIQDGDPTGTGNGGPGYTIPDEFHPDLIHDGPGVISMANAGPNTGGSQYFITVVPTPWLDGVHAIFGHIIEGMDNVFAISEVPTNANDKPLTDVVIDSIRVLGVVYPHIDLEDSWVVENTSNSDADGIINPLEEAQVTFKIKSWTSWADAQNTEATLETEDTRITITNGNLSLGTLANGDSTDNLTIPLEFYVNTNEAFKTTINLKFTANANSNYPFEVIYPLEIDITLNQFGFPFTTSSRSSALLLDIDNDGTKEMVFGDDSGNIHAVKADGINELNGFPVNIGGGIRTALAADDFGGDGKIELIASTMNGKLIAVDYTGSVVFQHSSNGIYFGNPMIADVDGNGTKEIIGITSTGFMNVIDFQGNNFGAFPVPIGGTVLSPPATADLDGDGNLEIIFTSNANGGSLHAVSTNNAQEINGFPYQANSVSTNGVTVAELNSTPNPEILVGLNNGELLAIASNGSLLFSKTANSAIKSGILASDLNNDSANEIAFVSNNGTVYITDSNGNDFFGFPLALSGVTESTPILADLNGNGTFDLLFGDNDGFIHAVDVNGIAIDNFPLEIGGTLKYSASIGRLDSDSDFEITMPSTGFFAVIDFKTAAFSNWSVFRANPQRTGNALEVFTSIERNENAKPNSFQLSQNHPNPFNPKTSINYELQITKKELGKLVIFNVLGKKVKEFILTKSKGTIIWDGKNELGIEVSSGIYFYRLESTANQNQTRKMLLLK